MTKYLLKRILRSILSVIVVVMVVMVLIYSMMDRQQIFAKDPNFSHQKLNSKEIYMMQQWEKYGYVDYIPYADWLEEQLKSDKISKEVYNAAVRFGNTAKDDSSEAAKYVAQFTKYYESKGYQVVRRDAVVMGNRKNRYHDGGKPTLFAYKDLPLAGRVWNYFTGLIKVENIHDVEGIKDADRGLEFTLHDPAYGGKKFSPAILGNGTNHRYLLYFSDSFPYIHQNLVQINLGTSYTVDRGVDIFKTMTESQGLQEKSMVTYPSGMEEMSADNIHSVVYEEGSLSKGTMVVKDRYVNDYTKVERLNKNGLSKLGYSFVIGIIATIMAYVLAIPLGTLMALKKDKFVDKVGTLYIVFIMAVPSLAYIFMFKAIGEKVGLPTTFNMNNPTTAMYILPIVSLALPSVANLMKWLRRYMIDQMNSDYVKFARSGGLSEGEIFSKHVLKNAIIPIVHGIPGSVLGAMVGAIITERVYVVPGAGNLLTKAIEYYDNGVIVGVTLFYALISVTSVILGDILMSIMDPRISFTAKER